jgi:hypothetical protein
MTNKFYCAFTFNHPTVKCQWWSGILAVFWVLCCLRITNKGVLLPVWKYVCKCEIVFNVYRKYSMWLVGQRNWFLEEKINLKQYGNIKTVVKHTCLQLETWDLLLNVQELSDLKKKHWILDNLWSACNIYICCSQWLVTHLHLGSTIQIWMDSYPCMTIP